MGLIKVIMTEASDRYKFPNPYHSIIPLKLRRKHIEPFSIDDVNLIINKVRKDYKNYYTVRFYTGMWTGVIDGLKWKFIDFKNRCIFIRETFIDGATEYTKTDGSQRTIPMLVPVYDALRTNMNRLVS